MKTIIITGTSGGLGEAFFQYFCKQPVYLVCIARTILSYQENIAKKNNNIKFFQVDLSELEIVRPIFHFSEIISDDTDEVIFINNASVIEPIGAIGELNTDLMIKAINVNFSTPLIITNELLIFQKTMGIKVKILNISSGAAFRPIMGWSVYCSTKAGCKMFFDVLNIQKNNSTKISVNNIDPGIMDTNMQYKIRTSDKEGFPMRDDFVKLKEENKLLSPFEVALNIIKLYIET